MGEVLGGAAATAVGQARAPRVSVIIATRDRGPAIATALASVCASTFADWELVIVDQSRDDQTEQAVAPFVAKDARVRYIRSESTGVSAARNVAIRHSDGAYLAVTDDDCEVAPDWLATLVHELDADPRVGFVAGALIPTDFDPSTGDIPKFLPGERRVVERPWPITECFGADMALRRSVLEDVGLFDEQIGPGAKYSVLDEQEMCHRVLLKGYRVLITPEAHVIHYGFRSNAQLPLLWRRDGRGVGGLLAREARFGDVRAVTYLLGWWGQWLGLVVMNAIRGRRPLKLRQALMYVYHSATAFAQGLRQPLAPGYRVYAPQSWISEKSEIVPAHERQQAALQGKPKHEPL